MKTPLTILAFTLVLQSCITIKVYQSEEEEKRQVAPQKEMKQMLPMGKTIHLDGRPHGLQFFGDDSNHFEVFAGEKEDSLKVERIHIITHKQSDSTHAQWVPKGKETKVMVFRTDRGDGENDPLMIVDGKRVQKGAALSDLDPASIETIEVLKGEAAERKYGPEGKNGVVEITTKKD